MNISDKNKRRIASLILLCLAVVFGKNFDEKVEKGTYDSLILSLNDQIDSLNNGILKLDNNRKTVTKQDFITLENGGIGRITFQASYNPMVGDSSLENSNQNKEAILQVWSSSSGSEASLLQSFTLESSKGQEWKDIILEGKSDFSDLRFEREGSENAGEITISNLNLTPIQSGVSAKELRSTIFGGSGYTHSFIETAKPESLSPLYSFNKKNTSIGEVFKSDSDYLSFVDLCLDKRGNGGAGKYRLVLMEAERENDGKFKLASNPLSVTEFGADFLSGYLVGDKTYRFPLPAFLKKGSYYFIGIDNSAAKINILHHLRLYGAPGKTSSDLFAGKIVEGNSVVPQSGNAYFKLFGADFVSVQNTKLALNSKIEDMGRGEFRYSYQSDGTVSDFLNLDSWQSANKKSDPVFYDAVQKGISGPAKEGTGFIYKVDTILPFEKFSCSIDDIGGAFFPVTVYYSTDNKVWQKISQKAEETTHRLTIPGNGGGHYVWIKATYDPELKPGSLPLLGTRNFRFSADIKGNL